MSESTATSTTATLSRERENRLMRKVAWRTIPLVFVGYIFSYFDRTNISFAALTMNEDLDISAYTYGWLAGIFFLGYIAFGVPSSLALGRFGARRWLSALMIAFGVISMATAFVNSVPALALLRFLLGVTEAGVFPGIIIYLTLWFPARFRGRVLTAFIIAVPLSAVIGGPLAGVILRMHDQLGMDGWRWLFLVEGLPAVLIGLAGLWLISSAPSDAKWLDRDERDWLVGQLRTEAESHTKTEHIRTRTLLHDPKVAVLALAQTCSIMAFYAVALWLPQLLKQITTSTGLLGLLAAIPFAAAIPSMILFGRYSDRGNSRSKFVAFAYALISIGLVLAALAGSSAWALVGLSIVAIGNLGGQSSLFALPGKLFAPAAAAASVAIISSVSNIGGFAGPYLTGALKETYGGFSAPFVVLAALTAAAAIVVGTLVRRWEREHVDNSNVDTGNVISKS
ncbi:MFS transporter [Rhodococcus koreensis]